MMAKVAAIITSIIFLALLSCGPKPKVKPLPPKGSPEAVLATLTSAESNIFSVAQTLKIEISSPESGEQSLTGTLIYEKGLYLLQIESLLGKDVAKLRIDGNSLLGVDPIENRYYTDGPNSMIPKWGIGAKDIFDLLSGKYGLLGATAQYAGLADDYYFFELDEGRIVKKITARPEMNNITAIRLEQNGGHEDDAIDVRFSGFVPRGEAYRPRNLVFSVRGRGITIRISIKSEKLNSELPERLFMLSIPQNASKESAESFWRNF